MRHPLPIVAVAGLLLFGCRSDPESTGGSDEPPTLGRYARQLLGVAPERATTYVAAGAMTAPASAIPPDWLERAWRGAAADQDLEAARELATGMGLWGQPLPEIGVPELRRAAALGFVVGRARAGAPQSELDALLSVVGSDPDADEARLEALRAITKARKWASIEKWLSAQPFSTELARDRARRHAGRAMARAGRRVDAGIQRARIRSSHQRDLLEGDIALTLDAKGQWRKAKAMARRIESKLVRVQTMVQLAERALRRDESGRGGSLLADALEQAADLDEPMLEDEALGAVLSAQLRWRLPPTVRAEALSEDVRSRAFASLVRHHIERGHLTEARAALEAFEGPGHLGGELRAELAALEASKGQLSEALQTVGEILMPSTRWKALGRVLAGARDEPLDEARIFALERALRPGF